MLWSLRLFGGVTVACSFACFGQDATPPAATPAPVAYAYVGGGTYGNSTAEKITAFRVRANGSTVAVPGSPVTGPAFSLAVSSGFLFGTDGTHIATYTRNTSNGAIRITSLINGVAHNDTPQGSGVGAMTLDRTGRNLYAGEINFQGADNDAYAIFRVGAGGRLGFVANTGINVNYGGPLSFSQNNRYAYGTGCYFLGWDLFGLARASNGTLTSFDPKGAFPPNPGNNFLCPFANAASAQGYLALNYVAEDATPQTSHLVTYHINANGTLSIVNGSSFTTSAFSRVWFDPTGTYLAAAGPGVSLFKLINGKLFAWAPRVAPNVSFSDVKWDSRGHVYALSANGLYIWTLSGHKLIPAPGSPHAVAPKSITLAVLPTV
jgi:hypothetical protein